MNTLDIIILVLLIWGGIAGFRKGFFLEAAALLGLVLGIYLAVIAADIAGRVFSGLVNWNPLPVKILAFIVVFGLIVVVLKGIGTLITEFLKAIMLNFINRIAGMVLGVAKFAFLISVVFLFVAILNEHYTLIPEHWLENSYFYDKLQGLAPSLFHNRDFLSFPEKINV
jgi:membrane protein required for colicin V production